MSKTIERYGSRNDLPLVLKVCGFQSISDLKVVFSIYILAFEPPM